MGKNKFAGVMDYERDPVAARAEFWRLAKECGMDVEVVKERWVLFDKTVPCWWLAAYYPESGRFLLQGSRVLHRQKKWRKFLEAVGWFRIGLQAAKKLQPAKVPATKPAKKKQAKKAETAPPKPDVVTPGVDYGPYGDPYDSFKRAARADGLSTEIAVYILDPSPEGPWVWHITDKEQKERIVTYWPATGRYRLEASGEIGYERYAWRVMILAMIQPPKPSLAGVAAEDLEKVQSVT